MGTTARLAALMIWWQPFANHNKGLAIIWICHREENRQKFPSSELALSHSGSTSFPLSIALSHPFAYCDCLAFDSAASLLRNYRVLSRCRIRCKRQFNHMFCQQHVARSHCCKVPLCPLMGQLATNGNGCNTTPTSLCPRHSFQGSFWPRLLLRLYCVCSSHAFEPCDFWHCHKVIIVKISRSWEMLIFQL